MRDGIMDGGTNAKPGIGFGKEMYSWKWIYLHIQYVDLTVFSFVRIIL